MTSDDPPVTAPASESLQFDQAEFTAASAAPAVACTACHQPIASAYYEVNGRMLCSVCRDQVVAHFASGSGLVRFLRAVLLGGLAALAGTAIYATVLMMTGYEAALVAILVGFMVGAAVRKGARHRGGLAYQLLAVFLTYSSIVWAYVPLLVSEQIKQAKGKPPAAAVAGANAAPGAEKEAGEGDEPETKKTEEIPPAVAKKDTPQPAAAPDPAKQVEPKPKAAWLLLALVGTVLVLYAMPFLQGVQNLLGLAIIFFGLLQAWRMNRKLKLAINGPFQVSSGGPPPEELPAHA